MRSKIGGQHIELFRSAAFSLEHCRSGDDQEIAGRLSALDLHHGIRLGAKRSLIATKLVRLQQDIAEASSAPLA
jgi:hypothetical protein